MIRRLLFVALLLGLIVGTTSPAANAAPEPVDRPPTPDHVQRELAADLTARAGAADLGELAALADSPDAGEVSTKAQCFSDQSYDNSYDITYLDVTSYSAAYSCDIRAWNIGISTRDYWYSSDLDYIEFYFDTDDNSYTGCYGDDYSLFGTYDDYYGLIAGVFETPTCSEAYYVGEAAISHATGYSLNMAFYESSIGAPDAMWYYGALENMGSYTIEDIGDGYSTWLADFHPRVEPTPTPTPTPTPAPAPPVERVQLGVDGTFSRTKIALRASTVLNGSVDPAYDGAVVRLQKYTNGAWSTVSTKILSGTPDFSFTVTPSTTGVHKYRVHAPGNAEYVSDTSPTRSVTVYNARINSIRFNPPGPDRENLNGEYAVVKNTGSTSINLSGWKIDAGGGKTRILSAYSLASGASVKLHTGSGRQSAGHMYLKFGTPIWRDTYGKGRLYDANRRLISTYAY